MNEYPFERLRYAMQVARNVVKQQKKQRSKEARERSGLRVKHLLSNKATGGARTGKAARKALRADRKKQRTAQVTAITSIHRNFLAATPDLANAKFSRIFDYNIFSFKLRAIDPAGRSSVGPAVTSSCAELPLASYAGQLKQPQGVVHVCTIARSVACSLNLLAK